MSLIGQQVFVAPGVVFDGIGSGGGGSLPANPYFSSISTQVVHIEDYNAPGNYPGRIRSNSGSMRIEAQNGDLWELSLSSITVSSINGAAPGGGGVAPGANLTGLSTISVSSLTATNGIVASGGIQMSNTTIQWDTNKQAVTYYNAGDSNLYIQAVSTANVVIGTASNATALQVGTTSINMPTAVYMDTLNNNTANVSTINVSSINGNQTTNKTGWAVSTLTGGVTYIPQNNVAWPLSGDISVVSGHTYRISGALALSNAGGTGHTALLVSGGGAGFPSPLCSFPNSLANPGNNGLAGGVQAIFKPSASPVQVVGYNTDATQSTGMEFYWTNWLVEDLGTNLL
jgi:hypothetical protein